MQNLLPLKLNLMICEDICESGRPTILTFFGWMWSFCVWIFAAKDKKWSVVHHERWYTGEVKKTKMLVQNTVEFTLIHLEVTIYHSIKSQLFYFSLWALLNCFLRLQTPHLHIKSFLDMINPVRNTFSPGFRFASLMDRICSQVFKNMLFYNIYLLKQCSPTPAFAKSKVNKMMSVHHTELDYSYKDTHFFNVLKSNSLKLQFEFF